MSSRLGFLGLCGVLGLLASCVQESVPDPVRQKARAPATGLGQLAMEMDAWRSHAAYRFEANTDSFGARRE